MGNPLPGQTALSARSDPAFSLPEKKKTPEQWLRGPRGSFQQSDFSAGCAGFFLRFLYRSSSLKIQPQYFCM